MTQHHYYQYGKLQIADSCLLHLHYIIGLCYVADREVTHMWYIEDGTCTFRLGGGAMPKKVGMGTAESCSLLSALKSWLGGPNEA